MPWWLWVSVAADAVSLTALGLTLRTHLKLRRLER
jgi:hypothetical protein